MRPDTLSVILRSASFIALFQSAGMAIFLGMFGRQLDASRLLLQRVMMLSALAATVLLVGQYSLEAARMADDMSGILDPSLQMLALHSASSVVLGMRLLGLAPIVSTIARRGDIGATLTAIGTGAIAASFLLTGHTVNNPLRWVLGPLLAIHILIVTFWFGGLLPLYVLCVRETPVTAGRVTAAFSRVAVRLVPGVLVAGLLLAIILIRHLGDFRTGYGLSILAKFAGFVVLMGLAAWNKWRLGPAIATGDTRSVRLFRRSLQAEYVLIAAVLSITAMMTTLYSPE